MWATARLRIALVVYLVISGRFWHCEIFLFNSSFTLHQLL